MEGGETSRMGESISDKKIIGDALSDQNLDFILQRKSKSRRNKGTKNNWTIFKTTLFVHYKNSLIGET